MGQINSVHNGPVHVPSAGHKRVVLTGSSTEPVALGQPYTRADRGVKRRRAKAIVSQRRDEVARGAGFLQRLTTAQHKPGPS